jgi:hypothetical protein
VLKGVFVRCVCEILSIGETSAQSLPALPKKSFIPQRLSFRERILHEQPTVRKSITAAPRDPLIAQYFEQWLDAMVYQLFFPEELRSAQLDFFGLFSKTNLKTDSFPPENRLDRLRSQFEELYSPSHPLRGALFALQSLEVVRTIEGAK